MIFYGVEGFIDFYRRARGGLRSHDDDFLRGGRFLDFNRKGLRSFSNALDADVLLGRAGRAKGPSCEEKYRTVVKCLQYYHPAVAALRN
ncbi:unnamed protein product [Amoebophrya sp. A120]|nr:unnamed protein product [Amoebophrya sp. A120]|eukprot:GSA120T00014086001.1